MGDSLKNLHNLHHLVLDISYINLGFYPENLMYLTDGFKHMINLRHLKLDLPGNKLDISSWNMK